MRACTKCGEMKPLEAFPPVRRSEPKRQSWCRECFAEANARNYRKNHEREKARLVRQVAEKRARIQQQLTEYSRAIHASTAERQTLSSSSSITSGKSLQTFRPSPMAVEAGPGSFRKSKSARFAVRIATDSRRSSARPSRRALPSAAARESSGAPVQLLIHAALGIRVCRVCAKTKPLTEFPFRSLKRQTRQWICLLCQRAYTNEWYTRNRKRQIAKARIRRDHHAAQLRSWVRAYLSDHPCIDCGETNVDLLDFDHLRDKRANVSTLTHVAVSWDLVKREIQKCEVRCANCHRRKTAHAIGSYRVRWLLQRPGRDSNPRPQNS